MPTQKEELQLNTQQDMSSENMYVLKKLFTEYVSLYRLELNSGKYEILRLVEIRMRNSLSERNTRYLLIMMNLQDGMQRPLFRKQSRKNF